MNLHEYQGKEILASYGVSTQKGIVVSNADDAFIAAQKLNKETGTNIYVIKAQIHAGGRGKGGGVKIAKSFDEVKKIAKIISPITIKILKPFDNFFDEIFVINLNSK